MSLKIFQIIPGNSVLPTDIFKILVAVIALNLTENMVVKVH